MDIAHPGEHLAHELETLNISASELAQRVQISAPRIRRIIQGRESITGDTALRFAHFFGTSARFWMNLQTAYELQVADRASGQSIKRLPTLKESQLDRIPIPDTTVSILDDRAVQNLTSLSRSTLWRMERKGQFPKRLSLSPGRVGWRKDEIEAWIVSRSDLGKR